MRPLKQQLDSIEKELQHDPERGRELLTGLSVWFREGVEVSSPYPAEMFDVEKTLEQLYESLVCPTTEFVRASSQRQFERSFRSKLGAALKDSIPGGKLEDVGSRRLNGIAVPVGLRTTAPRFRALWRALSLQSEQRAEDQIAKAKSIALDISVVREMTEFKNDQQVVAVQSPRVKAAERFKDSLAWLKHEADEIIVVSGAEELRDQLAAKLSELSPH